MKRYVIVLATTALMATSAAWSQTAPAPGTATAGTAAATAAGGVTTGATVSDTSGGQVGTIKSVDGEFATVSTGTTEVRLPKTSFANGPNGPVIAMTKAQLEQAASGASADQKAKLSSQVTTGATVSDSKGGTVGKIEAVDAEFVTVATAANKVKLPLSAFAAGTSGPVIGMTAAELDAAASAAAPATPPKAGAK